MPNELPRYTLRIPQELLDKLGYIAEYEGRTKNREIEQLIKKRIAEPPSPIFSKSESSAPISSLRPMAI